MKDVGILSNIDKKIHKLSNVFINEISNFSKINTILDSLSSEISEVILLSNTFNNFSGIEIFKKFAKNISKRITIVTGLSDPSTKIIPFKPIHKLLLANDKGSDENLNLLENPTFDKISNLNFIFIDQHIVKEISIYIKM